MTSKLEQRLNRFPPFLCYALMRVPVPRRDWKDKARRRRAYEENPSRQRTRRHHYRRVTRKEFSQMSGIPERTLERLVTRVSWRDGELTVDQMLRFLDACKINLFNLEPVKDTLRKINLSKNKFGHLSTYQRRQFLLRIEEWSKYLARQPQA
jgi:hypothetical protein